MNRLRDIAAALVLGWQLVYLSIMWPKLPRVLPTHFGLSGTPDSYGSRSIVWVIFAASAALFLLLTIVQRFPQYFNLPAAPGAADRPRQEALARELIGWARLVIMVSFCILIWTTVHIGLHQSLKLNTGFLVMFVLLLFLPLVFIWRMRQRGTSAK